MTLLVPSAQALSFSNMTDDEVDVLRGLLQQWFAKSRRNLLRTRYYNGKNRLKDLGISIPPSLREIETVVGWPAKAVDQLLNRINFDGFVLPGELQDPYDLQNILDDNHFDEELPQGLRSSLMHSTAFIAVTQGDVQSGEPEIMFNVRSALYGTGFWDKRKRGLSAAVSITSVDDQGVPDELVLYLPEKVGLIARSGRNLKAVWRRNPLGRVPVEPLRFKPDLDRPFGRSRITREVMSLTDAAVRTVLRTEVSAEFYASPQRYALGVDSESFIGPDGNPIPAWETVMGRMFAVGKDEDGDVPTVGQFAQQSMQPHSDMLRSLAAQFSGATSVPVSALGIIHDNPSSAEAIYAAKEDIVIEAQNASKTYSSALVRVAQTAVMLRDGLDEVPDDLRRLQAKWANPARPSVVSAADAVVKQVSALPWLADTEVILEELGYDQPTITRLLSDKSRGQSASVLEQLMTNAGEPSGDAQAELDRANVLKAKADALGVLRRAGVDAEVAAETVGLGGIKFIHGQPITIKTADE